LIEQDWWSEENHFFWFYYIYEFSSRILIKRLFFGF
jgi:hypothetical protein